MKKKTILFVSMLSIVFCLAGCGKNEEVLHLGLNAEILEIDAENHDLIVKDIAEADGVFGEKSVIDCSKAVANSRILYCNYITGDVKDIDFENLQVGDEIIVEMYDSEVKKISDGTATVEQIQLGTQRMN
jgi:hypothetical protein